MGRATAMILAAGRGDRMRPLTDALPKPLLEVAGKPLVVHQIEALARAGHRDIAINASHLAHMLVDVLGDGREHGVTLHWSIEPEPLETLGGIATARPMLADGQVQGFGPRDQVLAALQKASQQAQGARPGARPQQPGLARGEPVR